MAVRRKVSSDVSAYVLEYVLRESRLTQEQLAEAIEVSAAFISRVRAKERSLTIEHLSSLADIAGAPLGALLLAAVPVPKPRPETQKLHDLARKAILQGDIAVASIRRHRAKAG